MNRAESRRQTRNFKKNLKTINKLTPQQAKIIDIAAREKAEKIANERLEEFGQIIDRSMSTALLEYDWNLNEIEELQKRMRELLVEDTQKINKLEEENVDIMKIQEEVRQAIEGLLEKGIGKKQAIDELVFKFPKLSRNMISVSYLKIKKEKEEDLKITRDKIVESAKKYGLDTEGKKKIAEELGSTYSTISTYVSRWKITEKEIKEEIKTDEAVKKILDIIDDKPVTDEKLKEWDEKYNPNGELATEVKEIEKAEENIKEVKEIQCKEAEEGLKMEGLKILEEKIVRTIKVQGENGTYEAETGKGVILSKGDASISFKSIEQLNEWAKEFTEVFEMIE